MEKCKCIFTYKDGVTEEKWFEGETGLGTYNKIRSYMGLNENIIDYEITDGTITNTMVEGYINKKNRVIKRYNEIQTLVYSMRYAVSKDDKLEVYTILKQLSKLIDTTLIDIEKTFNNKTK